MTSCMNAWPELRVERIKGPVQVTALASEERLGVDFSDIFASSGLARCMPCCTSFERTHESKIPSAEWGAGLSSESGECSALV